MRILLLATLALAAAPASAAPNVLFVAVDDLNDWVGHLRGHPQALTPNLDRLAARGTAFTNAHCQAPLCNPSRTSLLTGLRPTRTGVYGLAPGFRAAPAARDRVTLPQTFTQAGYFTFICGKIYHDGSVPAKARPAEFGEWGPAPGMGRPAKRFAQLPGTPHPLMDWGPFPERDADAADHAIADAAIAALQRAPTDKPFFVACGFRLPHVPCFAPPAWFDKFPADRVELPPVRADDRADTPRFSWYLHWKLPEPRLRTLEAANEWRPLVRGYLASTAFMDQQLGRVLDALEKTGRANDTVVVVWSDHGYHLGEKGISGKNSLWERATRVPLVFAGPGVARGGRCGRPAELLDVYPTLLDLAGLPPRGDLDGLSLAPQLRDAAAPRDRPALTTHNPGNHAVRSERWRYIRYADGSEELYDTAADPHEWTNRAADPALAAVKRELAKWLPASEEPHAPGSAHRVLMYDARTGAVTWEGAPVGPTDAVPTP